ncbi:hypothetical protein MFAL_31050 [Mycolicibacterium fallax]|nr:hypothetical protein MFAL_31050 [Mycolicibacterium fallax]
MTTVTLEFPVPIQGELPEKVGVTWIADLFGLTRRGVITAVESGRLPALKVGNTWAIDPRDALRLWGWRLTTRTK